jgi:transglutaminase 1
MDVTYNEYASALVDQASFNIACMAAVKDTQFEYFAQDDFRVRKPDIKFKVSGKINIF